MLKKIVLYIIAVIFLLVGVWTGLLALYGGFVKGDGGFSILCAIVCILMIIWSFALFNVASE